MATFHFLMYQLRLFPIGSRCIGGLNTGDEMRVLRITGFDFDALCTPTTRNLLFAQYELVDQKASVTSDEQEEERLCFSSADALLPKTSAEPRCVARVVPEASERAEQGHLLERASTGVASHLARPVPKRLLALLS